MTGEVTAADRDAAFDWARQFRLRCAALRLDLQEGRLTLPLVLADRHHAHDGAMKLLYVLESLPGARKVGTRRRLAELGVAEAAPLRSLDDGTCAVLLGEFPMATAASAPEP